jgi:hypothetical protein
VQRKPQSPVALRTATRKELRIWNLYGEGGEDYVFEGDEVKDDMEVEEKLGKGQDRLADAVEVDKTALQRADRPKEVAKGAPAPPKATLPDGKGEKGVEGASYEVEPDVLDVEKMWREALLEEDGDATLCCLAAVPEWETAVKWGSTDGSESEREDVESERRAVAVRDSRKFDTAGVPYDTDSDYSSDNGPLEGDDRRTAVDWRMGMQHSGVGQDRLACLKSRTLGWDNARDEGRKLPRGMRLPCRLPNVDQEAPAPEVDSSATKAPIFQQLLDSEVWAPHACRNTAMPHYARTVERYDKSRLDAIGIGTAENGQAPAVDESDSEGTRTDGEAAEVLYIYPGA